MKIVKQKITKQMSIGEVVNNNPEVINVFMEHGLHCIGCAAAHFENIEQGCQAHGIDADKLVLDLNKAINPTETKKVEKKTVKKTTKKITKKKK